MELFLKGSATFAKNRYTSSLIAILTHVDTLSIRFVTTISISASHVISNLIIHCLKQTYLGLSFKGAKPSRKESKLRVEKNLKSRKKRSLCKIYISWSNQLNLRNNN